MPFQPEFSLSVINFFITDLVIFKVPKGPIYSRHLWKRSMVKLVKITAEVISK